MEGAAEIVEAIDNIGTLMIFLFIMWFILK
jgi:hypothetical protein